MGEKRGFEVLHCCVCKTLYVSSLPTNETRMAYETGGYYSDENLVVPGFIAKRLDQIVQSFGQYRSVNRLLDIGCGAGGLLMAAKRAQWDAEGVEVSRPTVEYLRNNDLKVFPGELLEARFPTGHFDVVTAGELIEHVTDPSSLVGEVARILRPGGIFWATTPHGDGASARSLRLKWSIVAPPEHLQLFSISGLTKLLRRHGFREVQVKSDGLGLTELLRAFRVRRAIGVEVSKNEGYERVQSDYQFNEKLLRNHRGRVLKKGASAVLRASGFGDFLKVWAER